MNSKPISLGKRMLGGLQILLAASLLLGSAMEIMTLLVPSLLAGVQDVALIQLHHSLPILFYGTLTINLIYWTLAAFLLRGGVGTLRADLAASLLSRKIILLFFAALAAAAVLCSTTLLSPIVQQIDDPTTRSEGILLLVMIFVPIPMLAGMFAALYVGHGVVIRRLHAVDQT